MWGALCDLGLSCVRENLENTLFAARCRNAVAAVCSCRLTSVLQTLTNKPGESLNFKQGLFRVHYTRAAQI